jgi:hypothetical protein
VVSVETLSGTHEGVYRSRLGPIEPTGRFVRWSRISIRTLDSDSLLGRVVALHVAQLVRN